jgi:Spy/CpxP family protein refolding chaperone
MKRRTIIGLAAAGVAGLATALTAAGLAFGGGGHAGFRHRVMQRMVTAALDEALDEAQVTPEQRARIHAARDRVFAAVAEERTRRHGRLEEMLQLFEADNPDPAALDALHKQLDAERARTRQTVHDALIEAHGVLTPAQRRALADYVRAHGPVH